MLMNKVYMTIEKKSMFYKFIFPSQNIVFTDDGGV